MSDIVIDIRELTKTLGGQSVLSGITLQIHRGTIFGYLGPNGSGKTTTLRILLGLLQPTSGFVRVMGQEPGRLRREIRAKIGVVLENRGLYERLTASQNLDYYSHIYRLSGETRKARIEKLLRTVDLWNVRNAKVGTFSNGMKQRLALARALLHNPEIIFLDEPTSGLDPEATTKIRKLILQLAKVERCTIFLNSHDLDEVERTCSEIAILKQGKILHL